MNPEAQRIAIAEACGWKRERGESSILKIQSSWWTSPDGKKAHPHPVSGDALGYLPDYLNDLNAMAEAESAWIKTASLESVSCWIDNLYRSVGLNPYVWMNKYGDGSTPSPELAQVVCATAAQRAEAFLKTLNLWQL